MTSLSNPQALANALLGQSRDVALLTGAGVSASLSGGAAVATWPGLLRSGLAFCQENVPDLHPSFAAGLTKLLENPDVETLVTVAEGISGKLGAPGGEGFARWLQESIGSLEVCDGRLVEALTRLDLPIATTNYDDLLAGLAAFPPVTWKDARKVQEVLNRKRQAIIHLHGHWDDPPQVILGGRSYGELIGDEAAQALVKSFFYTHSLLAIGCGEGMLDPNFKQLRDWLRTVDPSAPYYILVRAGEMQAAQRYEPFTPVAYGEEYDDLPSFLGELAAAMGPGRAAARPKLSGPVLPPDTDPIGRDVEMQAVLDYMESGGDGAASLAITGQAGIGKTFLVSAAMHRRPAVERYGQRRYFLPCSAVSVGPALLSQVAWVCGLVEDVEQWSANGDPALRAEAALARLSTPALLVLDNLEDALAQARTATLDAIHFLTEYFDVILTTRDVAGDPPGWMEEMQLGPLTDSAAERLIATVSDHGAGRIDLAPSSPQVLTPLDLRLAGLTALETSSERAVANAAAKEPGIGEREDRLLGVLAHAADGLPRSCVAPLIDNEGEAAAATLEQLGLIHPGDSTVLLVASVRPRLVDVAVSRRSDLSNALDCLTNEFDMRSLMIEFPGSVDGLLAALIADPAGLKDATDRLVMTLDAQMATGIRLSTAWSAALQATDGNRAAALRGAVLMGVGRLAALAGNIGEARAHIDSALELAEADKSAHTPAAVAVEAARVARLDDDPDRAAELLDRAAALHSGPGRIKGEIELERAFQALHVDDPVMGEQLLDAATEIFVEADFPAGVARVRQKRGEALRQQGRYGESRRELEAALPEARDVGDGHIVAHCLFHLGSTARHEGAVEDAIAFQREAMAAYEAEGNRLGLANVHKELGILCDMRGAFGLGRVHFANAADHYRLTGSTFGLANCLLGEAELEANARRTGRARDLANRAADLYRAIKHPRIAQAEKLLASFG